VTLHYNDGITSYEDSSLFVTAVMIVPLHTFLSAYTSTRPRQVAYQKQHCYVIVQIDYNGWCNGIIWHHFYCAE